MRPACSFATAMLSVALLVWPCHDAFGQNAGESAAGTAQAIAVGHDHRYWVPEAYFGLRLGNNRVIGEAGTIIPFTQYADRLLFGDARGRLDDRDSREFNLGLGYRQLVADDQLLVGGYVYFDQLRSRWDNTFRQLTVGSELQAERWSARVNAYRAGSSASPIEDQVWVETDLSGGGDPTLQLVDSYLYFLSSGGTETTFQTHERAINGADFEAGFRMPLRDAGQQLWLHGGWYRFAAGDVPTVSGPRVRADWRVPLLRGVSGARLNVGFEWQRDSVRGAQRFARLEFRMPIGGDRARRVSAGHDRWYQQRMTQAPVRDVDVITGVQQRVIDFREFEPISERAQFADSGMTVGRVVYASAQGGGDGSPGNPAGLGHAAADLVESYGLLVLDGTGGDISEAAELGVDHLRVLSGGASVELRGTTTTSLTATFSSDGEAAVLTQPLSVSGNGIVVDTVNLSAGLMADGVDGLSVLRSTLGDIQLSQVTGQVGFRDSIASSLRVDGGDAAIEIEGGQLSRGMAGSLVDIRNTTGSTLSISAPMQAVDGAGGITLLDNTEGTFGFSGSQILLSTGAHDAIHLSGNTGSDIAFTPDVLAIDTSGGAGLQAANGGRIGIAAGNASVSTVGAGSALSLDGLEADIRLDSVVSESAAATAISLSAVSGVVDVALTRVQSPGHDGIAIFDSTGAFSFGDAEVSGAGNDGVRLSGGPGVVGFGTLDIEGVGRTGIDFTDSDIVFSAQTLNIDGGETGIDLTRAGNTINVANGGALRNFGTVGVQFSAGDDFSDSANALFTFGGGSITAADGAFVMDGVGLNPALGLYDFTGTEFSGPSRFTPGAGQIGELFFVAANATGSGDGSSLHHLAAAGAAQDRADSGELTTFVFVNDGNAVDFSSLVNSTFTLGAGQVITGFGGGNALDPDLPINIVGDFAESAITDPTGNGAALLTTMGGSVITIGDNNRLGHVAIAGGGNAVHGSAFSGLLVQNTEFGAASSHLFSFVDATGSITLSNNTIDVAGDLLNVQGGDAELLLSAGGGTLIGRGVRVVDTTGGTVQISGASLQANGAAAVSLNNNAASVSFVDSGLASATDHYLFSIDQGSGSTGDITLTNVTQSGALAGGALRIGAGPRNVNAGGLNITGGNLSSHLIDINGQSGGTIGLGTVTSNDHAGSAHVIRVANQSGGTVNFGAVHIDSFSSVGSNALSLEDIAGTVNLGGTTSLNNVVDSAVVANNISGEVTIDQLVVDGAGGYGLRVGNTGASSGSITIHSGSIDGTASGGMLVNNTNLVLNNLILGGSGALANTGIEVINSDGIDRSVLINGTTVAAQGAGIDIVGSGAGDLRLALDGNTVNAGTGVGIGLDGSTGAGALLITSLDGNTVNTAGDGGIVIDGAIFDADPDAAGHQQVTGGNTTIGDVVNTASVSGHGLWLNDVLGDVAFGDLNIGNDDGAGLFIRDADKGGVAEFLFGNTGGSINTTHGTAMDIDPVTMAATFARVSSADAAGHGLFIDQISGSISIGETSVSNAGGSGIAVSDSDGDFSFGNTGIDSTGNHGLSLNGATGAITFDALSIESITNAGVDFEGFSGIFSAGTLNVDGGVTAIDLTNAGGTITVTNGGVLENFTGTGVQFSRTDNTDDSVNATFTFGGGSIIGTGGAVVMDGIGLDETTGSYDFTGVAFSGPFRFSLAGGGVVGDLFFVAANATGSGDGSSIDSRAGVGAAQARADTGLPTTFVFINDGDAVDFSVLGGDGFTLSDGQVVSGFGNGNSFGLEVPTNLTGDFDGLEVEDPGNGAASLTNSGGSVVTLASDNRIANVDFNGGTNSLAGNGFANFTLEAVTLGGSSNYLFNFTSPTGELTFTDLTFNAFSGGLLNMSGSAIDLDLSGFNLSLGNQSQPIINIDGQSGGTISLGNITSTNQSGVDAIVRTANQSGGTVNFGNVVVTGFNSAGNSAVNLAGTGGTVSFQNLSLAATSGHGLTAAGIGLNIATGDGISSADGRALSLNNVTTASGITLGEISANLGTGPGVDIQNSTGNITLGNTTVNATGSGPGVRLQDNTGNYVFGNLSVTTNNQTAVSAINGATSLTVSNATGVLNAGNATALLVQNTPIGEGGLNFQSITSIGGSATGIILDGTGSAGGLVVAGTGTAGSGGTIADKAGANNLTDQGVGIYLNNTGLVELHWMQLNDFTNYGIYGTNVSGFQFNNSVISGSSGNSAAAAENEGAVRFNNLTGQALISNSSIGGGFRDNFHLINTSGVLNRIVFDNVTFGGMSTTEGNDSLFIGASGTATVNVTVQNSTFTSARGDIFQMTAASSGGADLLFTGNAVSNNHTNIPTGGGGVTITGGDSSLFSLDINNNSFRDAIGHAVLIVKEIGSGSLIGSFADNTIGVVGVDNSGSLEGSGLNIRHNGGGTMTMEMLNNSIHQYNNFGINMQAGAGVVQSGEFNLVLTGNIVSHPGNNPAIDSFFRGIHLNSGVTPGDSFQVCFDAQGNTMTDSGRNGGQDIRLRQRQNTTVRLPGYGGGATDTAAVQSYLEGRNVMPFTGLHAAASTGFVGGGDCI